MKNYVQPGDTISVTCPYATVAAGAGVLVGALFGVAANDATTGNPVEIATEGVFDIVKEAPLVMTAGDRLWWDDTNKRLTKTNTSNYHVAICLVSALSADTTVRAVLMRSLVLAG